MFKLIDDFLMKKVNDLCPGVTVTCSAPVKDELSVKQGRPTVNVYLYELRDDTVRTQTGSITVRGEPSAGLRHVEEHDPPRWAQLSYMITAWSTDVTGSHNLLASIYTGLASIRSFPLLEDDQPILGPDKEPLIAILEVGKPLTDNRTLSEVWSTFQNPVVPFLNAVASVPLFSHSEKHESRIVARGGVKISWSPRSLLPDRQIENKAIQPDQVELLPITNRSLLRLVRIFPGSTHEKALTVTTTDHANSVALTNTLLSSPRESSPQLWIQEGTSREKITFTNTKTGGILQIDDSGQGSHGIICESRPQDMNNAMWRNTPGDRYLRLAVGSDRVVTTLGHPPSTIQYSPLTEGSPPTQQWDIETALHLPQAESPLVELWARNRQLTCPLQQDGSQIAFAENSTATGDQFTWEQRRVGNNVYMFINKMSGLLLQVTGIKLTQGEPSSNPENQLWRLEGSALYLAKDDKRRGITPDFHGDMAYSNIVGDLIQTKIKEPGSASTIVTITSLSARSLALDISQDLLKDGSPVHLTAGTDRPTSKWQKIETAKDGEKFWLVNLVSGHALTVTGDTLTQSLWDRSSASQQWIIKDHYIGLDSQNYLCSERIEAGAGVRYIRRELNPPAAAQWHVG
ncbi:Pvc16 family protein [Streptomyces vinaceus]|uniref:Pvc16 family protein n=1 Tax=Streptomyces vinaceus TaxID=1960 RepID=UPI0036B8261A